MPRGRRPAAKPTTPAARHSGYAPRRLSPPARAVWANLIQPRAREGLLGEDHEPAAVVACEAIAAALYLEDRIDRLTELCVELVKVAGERGSESLDQAAAAACKALERTLESPTRLRAEARLQAAEWGGTLASASRLSAARPTEDADPMAAFLGQ